VKPTIQDMEKDAGDNVSDVSKDSFLTAAISEKIAGKDAPIGIKSLESSILPKNELDN
jgi:hypothetical protein